LIVAQHRPESPQRHHFWDLVSFPGVGCVEVT
jgi:hypothetical protein